MCVIKERRWGRRKKCEIKRSVSILLTSYCILGGQISYRPEKLTYSNNFIFGTRIRIGPFTFNIHFCDHI